MPLWGDVTNAPEWNDKEVVVERISDGGGLSATDGQPWHPSHLCLLRRHPAIADLPGIRVEPAEDANKSTIVADKYSGFVGDKPPIPLRPGMRVRHEVYGEGHVCSFIRDRSEANCYFGPAEWGYMMVPVSDLTPIPPPLIDNGDDTWMVEGYEMFRVAPSIDGTWLYEVAGKPIYHTVATGFPTKEAAAEDLWRRMNGGNQ